ncbi:protein kinase family protein [Rhodocyclus tenuis]|uniref:Serine/threonine protein kinase n=1 Tax=Rhodocyclus tenuis TaxID=1066 RepID=A0A840G8Y8_RHOTE|nr:protein kinase family protein [Rhodocyclus tenuis]MBB4248803.1 hypothetical protein [Rhodocyclus tenuis]
MAYPSFEQYNNAFQAHDRLLADPELKKGVVSKSGLGTPHVISGGFALTYTVKAGSKKYAVRCFHRESKALERRYQAIARRLAQLRSPYFLDFEFQPQGISVDGGAYPIVKMAWAQGVTLGEFLEDNHGKKGALASLPASLLALSKYLESERVAHGDIQTGNMMVSGGSAVQLIDYDGMFVEDIKDLGSSELGHVNFQHPERKAKNPFGPTMDRFSLITLSLALKALHEEPALWDKTGSDMDSIVFRANDFADPASSSVFSELMRRPALVAHAQHFAAICRAPIEKVPNLEDFLAGKNIPAGVVQITAKPQEGRPKPGYMGVYDVLAATNYALCLRRVGDKVEVIGRISEVKVDKARNGKPYIFINFGPWQGQIFKISIWSEGLAAIANKPDASWVSKWVSVVGLMEPPYVSRKYKYSHLSINVTANGQMSIITEVEAKFRLASAQKISSAPSSNREALDRIKGKTSPKQPAPGQSPPASPNKSVLDNIHKAQGASQARPAQTSSPPQPQAPYGRPTYPQQPQEKGLFGRLIDWLFK